MKFNFHIDPSSMTLESIVAIIFVAIIFIAIPIMLSIAEHRLTKKNKKSGLHLLVGIFATTILLGIYSIYVGVLPLIIYFATLKSKDVNENTNMVAV